MFLTNNNKSTLPPPLRLPFSQLTQSDPQMFCPRRAPRCWKMPGLVKKMDLASVILSSKLYLQSSLRFGWNRYVVSVVSPVIRECW